MANTTNFGWETPDDTDLVKDGAAAIRTLGGAIDTSLVDLKGGTTDQVLAKNSNTDMDFKWVTSDDANAIQNAIVDAKGDLISASAADTPARLAVGNDGETLVADSSASTGLRWQPSMSAGKNCIVNGSMDIFQRGTSFTVASTTKTFTADRWIAYRAATGLTASRQSSGLAGFTYSLRMQRDSGNASTTTIYLGQNVEILNASPYIDKTVTVSFWAKAGANYSAASSALGYQLTTGTNTSDQDGFLAGYTGSATPISATATLTTSWQRFSASGTISSTATQFYVSFNTVPVGTAGADDWFEVTGVQVELGSAATAFSRAGGTLAGELAACQRYYYRVGGSQYAMFGVDGFVDSATNIVSAMQNPTTMRVSATSVEFSAVRYVDFSGTAAALTALTISSLNSTPHYTSLSGTTTGATAGRGAYLGANNNANAYIGISAEL